MFWDASNSPSNAAEVGKPPVPKSLEVQMIGQILSTLWMQMDRRWLQPFANQWSPESKDVVQMIVKFIHGVGCRVSWEGVCPGAKHQATWKHSERCEVFQSFEMRELYFESLVCSEFIPKPVRCSCSGWRGLEFQQKDNSTMQWGKKPNIETQPVRKQQLIRIQKVSEG